MSNAFASGQRLDMSSTSPLRALDPELPILAARAGVQLDNLIARLRKQDDISESPLDAVTQLAGLVSEVKGKNLEAEAVKALWDPVTASVLSRAYSEANNQPSMKSFSDLIQAATKLAELFGTVSNSKIGDLELLRDFCVKLSDYAASRRQSVFNARPYQPYRKVS